MVDRILPEDDMEILRVAARNPTLRMAAMELGVSYQTLKNRLSEFYQGNGYTGLAEALYHELVEPRSTE
jgi:hypothetical protein